MDGEYEQAQAMLAEMVPAKVDLELRELETDEDVEAVLRFLLHYLRARDQYEMVQACLNVVLRVHSERIMQSPALAQTVDELQAAHEGTWRGIEYLTHFNMCLVKSLSKML